MGNNESNLRASTSNQSSNEAAYEPIEAITSQACSESVKVIEGKHDDRPIWHIILVPYERQAALEQKKTEAWMQIDELARNIRYRDRKGAMRQASGYGSEPPQYLIKWINENYDPCAIDENTPLTYTIDDIRLCTIQRLIPEEELGIILYYHRHERLHYVKLSDDHQSTLAFRAGIKPFDRIIEYNGINIEAESTENLKKRIEDLKCERLQLLVCSPATYVQYKTNKKHLRNNLTTVQRLKPVHDVANSRNNYAIELTENSLACITLVNSMHTAESSFYDSQFLTAQEPPVANAVGYNTLQAPYEQKNDGRERREVGRQKLRQQLTTLLGENQNNVENDIEVHHIQCCSCGSPRIYGDRYRCLECRNYDLCGRCFDQRHETNKHKSGHVMVHFSDSDEIFGEAVMDIHTVTLRRLKEKYSSEEHANTQCNMCETVPIQGLRFKCDICHDLNLCITCMGKRVHDQTHPLLAFGKSCFAKISIKDIELNDELGRGGFGTVYKANWVSKSRPVACKIIDVRPEFKHHEKSFRKELAAYAEVSGPYILKTYGYHIEQLPEDRRRCLLVMEFMPRGSLTSVLRRPKKLRLLRKLKMAYQIASGMRKIHAHRMIHRDIRPDNILVALDYTAKIGDMGLARKWMPDENLTTIGCLPYMPWDFYTGKYDQSLDVFTFGLTIYELFMEHKHHFDQLSRQIKITKPSPVFADLIARCIHQEPSRRPTAIEVETTLCMYKQAIEKHIRETNINYSELSIEDEKSTVITIYRTLQPELDEILKTQFSPAHPAVEINDDEPNADQFLKILERLGFR